MKNKIHCKIYCLIAAVIIVILVIICIYFLKLQFHRGFYILISWEKSHAVCDSIKLFHKKNGLYPQNWIDIMDVYEEHVRKCGYGFPSKELDTEININFDLLRLINDEYPKFVQVHEENKWIVRMKKIHSTDFEKEFFDIFYTYYLTGLKISEEESRRMTQEESDAY